MPENNESEHAHQRSAPVHAGKMVFSATQVYTIVGAFVTCTWFLSNKISGVMDAVHDVKTEVAVLRQRLDDTEQKRKLAFNTLNHEKNNPIAFYTGDHLFVMPDQEGDHPDPEQPNADR